ncbi:hypothetical protein E1J38_013125 [Seonamhaeicola sediminis]|uniref:Uncharacterized protein n=1 Tax=Seonamhaeicola sediminis TaxID=2528206 RepID=A0A562YBT6_9FLAO|nr:hypothetical protein [Seonamhaeicola sediminis]TWO31566.1 hypothetical protein E1J38_013125 [Seonamhaeicola sediminis]
MKKIIGAMVIAIMASINANNIPNNLTSKLTLDNLISNANAQSEDDPWTATDGYWDAPTPEACQYESYQLVWNGDYDQYGNKLYVLEACMEDGTLDDCDAWGIWCQPHGCR